MYTLERRVYGGDFEIRRDMPVSSVHRNVVFAPRRNDVAPLNDLGWGLYAANGTLIDDAAYRRGFARRLVGQSPSLLLENLTIEDAPPGNYLYGGILMMHFGHFLMGVVPRLWLGLNQDLSSYKIVCHGMGLPADWFSHGYIRDLFHAINLKEENFVNFQLPTRIPQITIPCSSCEEEHFAHPVYAEWGHKIGASLLQGGARAANARPVFLAKTEVVNIVHGAVNESEVVAAFEREGVEIVHPQELSIAAQVSMWRDRDYILGSAGSALHSSILWPSGARIAACSVRRKVHANCGIIDAVNENRISYTFPEAEPIGRHSTSSQNIQSCYRLVDPVGVAHGLLRAVGL